MASKYDSLIDEVAAPSTATPTDQYGALIDEVTSAAPLHSSLFEAMDSNPQEEAEKRKLAKQLNTPAAILPADAKQRALFTEVNAEELQSKAPSTAKFLTNPDNAKITGLQGVKSLTNIEAAARSYKPDEITRFIRDYTATGKSAAEASQKLAEMKAKGINLSEYNDPYRRTAGEAISDLGKTITSGTDRMVASMVELSRPLNRLTQALGLAMGATSEVLAKGSGSVFFDAARAAKDNVEQTQQTLNETAQYWQDSKSTGMKRLNDELAKAGALDSIGLLIKHPSLLADQLAQSIPYLAPGAAAARGGEAAVLVSNSLIEAADAANSAREQAKAFGATPEQQDTAATAAALVAAPLVFLGNKLLGTGKLEASFFTKGTTGHSLLQSAVREFVSGSIEEGANQLGANVGAATYDENQQLLEGVGKAALLGGFLESTHGVAMSATGRALQAYLDDAQAVGSAADNRMAQAAQAEAVQSAMASMSEAAATDTLRQNAPESFAEFVGTMVDDGAESDLKEVYVDGQTALQAMEPNYAELRQSAPELLATVEEAAANGTDAAISVPEYLTSIAGKPFEASILAALKADPTGVTYTEAQQFYQEQRKLFETDVAAVEVANEPVLSRTQYEATPVEGKTYDTYLKEHNNKREAYARDVEQVESSIMDQFQSAGRFTPSVNRTYTTPLVEFYKTQAKRLNMTPSELYAKYPFKVQSFLDFNPSTDLSQPNSATVEDLRPESIQGLLDKADWSILTPENPLGVATPERNPELRAQFEARLAEMGLQFMAVEGKYGNPENSYVVFGVTPEQALALGKEFNQESVLTRDGLIYQNGTRTPATGELTVFDTQPDDYYSKVTFPDGSQSVFSVGLDFDVSLQPGETYINPALIGADENAPDDMPGVFAQGENLREGQVSLVGVHYSKQQRNVLNGAYYGTGIKGAEGERLRDAKDARIRRRLYFYIDEGKGVFPEYGVGNFKHVVKLPNMYDASKNPLKLPTRDAYGQRDMNLFESAVLDAGFDGYYIREAFHRQGAAVMLGDASTSVEPMADVFAQSNSAPTFYSPLLRAVQDAKLDNVPASQWTAWLNSNAAKLGIKKDEIEWTGITDWLALQNGKVSKADVAAYLDSNGAQVEEVMRGARFTNEDELLLAELEGRDPVLDLPDESATQVLDTKYATYVVPGGENYKELLITLPSNSAAVNGSVKYDPSDANFPWAIIVNGREVNRSSSEAMAPAILEEELTLARKKAGKTDPSTYRSSHWDEPNILAHVRFDERTDTDGNKVLFINEVQSDWGQEGKKKGFIQRYKAQDVVDISAGREGAQDDIFWYFKVPGNELQIPKSRYATREEARTYVLTQAQTISGATTPLAPFVTDTKAWVALAVKRMMRYAVDNGFDKIAFINGQQAADLYDLSKQVKAIYYAKNQDGTYDLDIMTKDDKDIRKSDLSEDQLVDNAGKEIAEKIVNSTDKSGSFTGLDLRVGGEGMRAFYDQIVPQVVNDVLKKVGGGKVGVAEVSIGKGVIEGMPTIGNVYTEQKAITITPEMSAKIAQGQALFQTQPGGMRGSFNPGTLTMSLLNGSDLSTVIHESGHFYLEMLRTLANDQAATDELVADYMTTLGWFGLTKTEWESMTLDQQRPYHEQWAESFELWNLEGQAPTSELQPIFSRFRAWMLSVYKSVEEFLRRNPAAGKLNDEVRAVFSRLVASQDAILTTQAARGMQPLFDNAEQAGVSPAQFEEYTALGKRATDDAVASLQARSMRDMRWASNARSKALRELQKKAKAQRAAVREEVATEVMSEPVNQARTFLRTGKVTDPNTGELIEVVKGFKLDREMLDAMYPAGALDRPDLTAIRGMTSTDGLAPDTVAGMFGFTSGDALVRSLISEEPFGDKIEGLTDQRMLEEYGDLVDEKSMERAADEEVHNEARARFVATGLKILSKTPISVTQINKAAKAAAETQIGNKKVRDLRPKQYLAAETKANRAALAAVAKDPIEASRQQRNALLNNRLAMAAQEAVTEVEKAIKYLGKFNNEGTRKNLDLEYLEQIDAMLEPFDLRKGLSLTTIDAQTSLAEWIQQQEDMGFEPTIDPEQIANLRGKSYKNLTMSELRALVDTVKQVEHMGRMKKKLLTAIDKAEFAERIAEAKSSIALNANRSVPERGTPADTLGLFGQWFRQMMAAHRKFASYIRELDGGTWNGVMFDLMLRGATTAANTEAEMRAQASDRLGSLFSKLPTRFGGIMNMVARKKLIPGTTISLTDEQRVMVAMNWGNEGNRQRLLDGGITGRKALTPDEVRAILETLSKEEWDFVQGIFDFIAEYKPQIEALERTLTGKTPEWVEAAPIDTKFGIYPGGYFPAKYDTVLSTRSDALEAATDLRSAMRGAFGAAAARNGYTKARAQAVVGRPLLLNFNAISRHVNEVIHRLAWQPWLIDSNRVVKALDSDLRQTLGAEATKEMQDVLIDIARGDAPAATPVEVAINRVRAGTSIVGMGWKITTALLQPAGLTNSFARIGGRHMAKGLARYLANPIVADAWVNENSALMRNRGRTMNREMNEILNEVRTDKGTSALKGSYFYMIGKMQRMVDVPTYLGAYERALEELNFESAVDEADRNRITAKAHDIAGQTVKDVQGGGELMDLAKAQRGSPFSKLFTNFYSYMNTVYNMNVEAFRTTKFTSPTEVAIFTAEMLLINIVPVIMTVALKNLLKGDCAWDDVECVLAKYKSEQVSHFFGQVLLLREVGVAVDVATGGDAFGYSGPAGLRFFADLYKTGQQANQGDLDMPLIKSANNAAGALFHYPASSLNNVFETAVAVENGDVEGAAIIPSLIAGPPR